MHKSPRPGIDFLPDSFISAPTKPWSLWLQLTLFVVLFVAMQAMWSVAQGTVLEHVAVGDWTVKPAAFWINLATPDIGAQAIGYSIKAPGGGINVLNGCEGFEVAFLWVAALMIAPMSWLRRGGGLVFGVGLVWALNQVRILALFYTNRADKELFSMLHGTIAPLILVVLVAAAFVLFVAWSSKSSPISQTRAIDGQT